MVKTKLIFQNSQKKVAISPKLKKLLRQVCTEVLREEQKNGIFEISMTVVDDDYIHEINFMHRGIDAPTDVLSFPLSEDGESFDTDGQAFLLGDIVISAERAERQAEEYGHGFTREMAFLTAHSMLHLLGYDHVENASVPEEKFGVHMRQKEEKVLSILNITREEGEEI